MASPISPITDVIALAEFVGKAVSVVGNEIVAVEQAVVSGSTDVLGIINNGISRSVVNDLILKPLNISGTDISEANAQQAVDTLVSITSLILTMNEAAAGAAAIAESSLGNHAMRAAFSIASKIPSELGLNFFVGGVLHDMTMLAIEAPLLEALNISARPSRIDFRTLRLMLRQHLLTEQELTDWLIKLGYPDDLISKLVQLADTVLTNGEIVTAVGHGTMSEADGLAALEKNGLSANDAALLIADAHKSSSEGSTRYRAAARTAFAAAHISVSQFESILTGLGLSQADISLEVAAGQLEQHAKTATITLSQIKLAFEHGDIAQEAAISMLSDKGYAQADALFIVQSWASASAASSKGLSENRILAYMQSGVLTQQQAFNKLTARGMRPEDAQLLVSHPSASGAVYTHNLSPTTVQSALKDGAISVDEATALFKTMNVAPEEIALLIDTANTQAIRAKRAQNNPKSLPEATIKSAFENGIMSEIAAHRFLTIDGYSDTDATITIATWYASKNGAIPNGWVMIT